ncbi:MAG: hypothetical protein ACREFD_15660 [Stellaceae bacterium]
MAATPLDLFRLDNMVSARLDHVRPRDIAMFDRGGDKWVKVGTGGVSTWDAVDRSLTGRWWRLPAGTDCDDTRLSLVNDHANHRLWEPAFDMELAMYGHALARVSAKFLRV